MLNAHGTYAIVEYVLTITYDILLSIVILIRICNIGEDRNNFPR